MKQENTVDKIKNRVWVDGFRKEAGRTMKHHKTNFNRYCGYSCEPPFDKAQGK